ncbi:hypothetical protein LTR93_011780 [Exophiala xenobiotica]|nr:hypothetical protein LTR93_011780 [Exophiala xenobiotica]
MAEEYKDVEDLAPVRTTGEGEVLDGRRGSAASMHDTVFGEMTEHGPNYRNVSIMSPKLGREDCDGWLGTVALMMKTQIGLGVLSIPAVFDTLGLIPGVICLLSIAVITTWSDYIVGTFKLRHPAAYGIDDAGWLISGRPRREILGIALFLYWIFVGGSGMLGISIGLNAVSTHGACIAVFVLVAAIVGFLCGSIQTLGRISWLAWAGLTSIVTANSRSVSIDKTF